MHSRSTRKIKNLKVKTDTLDDSDWDTLRKINFKMQKLN